MGGLCGSLGIELPRRIGDSIQAWSGILGVQEVGVYFLLGENGERGKRLFPIWYACNMECQLAWVCGGRSSQKPRVSSIARSRSCIARHLAPSALRSIESIVGALGLG